VITKNTNAPRTFRRQREAIYETVKHLFAEALRTDFTAYTNRADFAQGYGMLDALKMLGLISESEMSDRRYELEKAAKELAREKGWIQ